MFGCNGADGFEFSIRQSSTNKSAKNTDDLSLVENLNTLLTFYPNPFRLQFQLERVLIDIFEKSALQMVMHLVGAPYDLSPQFNLVILRF